MDDYDTLSNCNALKYATNQIFPLSSSLLTFHVDQKYKGKKDCNKDSGPFPPSSYTFKKKFL
jgi:hypothetical protein